MENLNGLKHIFDMFMTFCNHQQDEKSCETCPNREKCEPFLFENARKELNDNGFNV